MCEGILMTAHYYASHDLKWYAAIACSTNKNLSPISLHCVSRISIHSCLGLKSKQAHYLHNVLLVEFVVFCGMFKTIGREHLKTHWNYSSWKTKPYNRFELPNLTVCYLILGVKLYNKDTKDELSVYCYWTCNRHVEDFYWDAFSVLWLLVCADGQSSNCKLIIHLPMQTPGPERQVILPLSHRIQHCQERYLYQPVKLCRDNRLMLLGVDH